MVRGLFTLAAALGLFGCLLAFLWYFINGIAAPLPDTDYQDKQDQSRLGALLLLLGPWLLWGLGLGLWFRFARHRPHSWWVPLVTLLAMALVWYVGGHLIAKAGET